MSRLLCNMFLLVLAINLSGCGFGGFTDGSTPVPVQSQPTDTYTTINGVVSKGPFTSGNVQIYAWNGDGSKVSLNSANIGAFGNYSAGIGTTRPISSSSTGTVLLQASGSYVDEATGQAMTITSDAPLRAAVPNATGKVTAAITPLTELAVRQVGNKPTADAVTAANTLLSDLFKIDILTTTPVSPTPETFGFTGTSQAQKDYTLVLAALSFMSQKIGSLADLLNYLSDSIVDGSMSETVAADFHLALTNFLASDRNKTGITDIGMTNLATAGGPVRTVKLTTSGALSPYISMSGISMTLQLPAYAVLRADYSGPIVVPFSSVVTVSGNTPSSARIFSRYYPATGGQPAKVTLSLASATGFLTGEFATIKCDIAAGATPVASDFKVLSFQAVDTNGATLFAFSAGNGTGATPIKNMVITDGQ